MSFDSKVMVFEVYEIGCVWKTPFCKSSHILGFTKAWKGMFDGERFLKAGGYTY